VFYIIKYGTLTNKNACKMCVYDCHILVYSYILKRKWSSRRGRSSCFTRFYSLTQKSTINFEAWRRKTQLNTADKYCYPTCVNKTYPLWQAMYLEYKTVAWSPNNYGRGKAKSVRILALVNR